MSNLEELTIEQLRELAGKTQEYAASHNLMQHIAKDPEGRLMFQRYVKKKNPNLAIPELDSEERMMKALEEEKKEREKLEDKLREDELRRRLEAERAQVMTKYKLSEDDVKAIEKRMVKTDENPDPLPPRYDWAAQLYINSRTPSIPTPASYSPPVFTMPDAKEWGKGIGNPAELNRIAMKVAADAWNEVMPRGKS